jgi:hypothetical protein
MRTGTVTRAAGIGAQRRTAVIERRSELPSAVASDVFGDRGEELG